MSKQSKFKLFLDYFLDFLFPKANHVETIEKNSAEELLRTLPASEVMINDIYSLFAYGDERVKHLVWEIKYYRNQKITNAVGSLLASRIRSMLKDDQEKYFLVPIPLTSKRLKERGFNHTELIARSIMKHLPENFKLATNILQKIKHTPKQSSIENREDRFHNLTGAFVVQNSELVKDKNIIVIDDVTTTGATILEVKKVLVGAGAKSVRSFVVAH